MARAIVGSLVGGTDVAGTVDRITYEVFFLRGGELIPDRVSFETSETSRAQDDDRALVAAVRARFRQRFGYELPSQGVSFHAFSKG